MLTIELTELIFYAYHGLYEEEKKLGASFEVNAAIQYLPAKLPVENIDETVDYTQVYAIIKTMMNEPIELLETLVSKMAAQILSTFSQVQQVDISVKKLNPPIIAFKGHIAVRFVMNRSQLMV
jgi:dihydroneopterin aldolase